MNDTWYSRIAMRRRALGWSQERLAQEIQLLGFDSSRSAINNIEHGLRRLDPPNLVYFAAALRVDPNWLLGWDDFLKR